MLAAILALTVLGADPDLSTAEFQRLHAESQTAADAPWRTIPWQVSLWEARQQAARQQKPIFIWAMDGHPLGCT
jgi:hypothetical protein